MGPGSPTQLQGWEDVSSWLTRGDVKQVSPALAPWFTGQGFFLMGRRAPLRAFDLRPESWRVVSMPAVCVPLQASRPCQVSPQQHGVGTHAHSMTSRLTAHGSLRHLCKNLSWRIIISTLLQIAQIFLFQYWTLLFSGVYFQISILSD